MDFVPPSVRSDRSAPQGYLDVTSVERDWILSGAVGYFYDLELARAPAERISANIDSQGGFLGFLGERKFKQRMDKCLLHLRKSEESEVKLDRARSVGLGGSEDLLCLASLQFVFATQLRSRRLVRAENGPEEELWATLKEFVEFCHTRAYALVAMYEERQNRDQVNRKVPRDPADSYLEWRRRAAPLVTEMRPVSVQFVRLEATELTWREDRTLFQRTWLDRQIADGWRYGSEPYR